MTQDTTSVKTVESCQRCLHIFNDEKRVPCPECGETRRNIRTMIIQKLEMKGIGG